MSERDKDKAGRRVGPETGADDAFLDELLGEAFDADAMDLPAEEEFEARVLARIEAEHAQQGAVAPASFMEASAPVIASANALGAQELANRLAAQANGPRAQWKIWAVSGVLGLGAAGATSQLGGVFRFIADFIGYDALGATPLVPMAVLCLFASGLAYMSMRAVDVAAN